jgi:hypothetical protein
MEFRIDKLFRASIDLHANEFHVTCGQSAVFCIHETNVPLDMQEFDDA